MEVVIGIASSVLQGAFTQGGINQQLETQGDIAQFEIRELQRQEAEDLERAQTERAQRVREADEAAARVVVAMGEMGGGGTNNEGRLIGEVGAEEGLDVALIEGNFRRRSGARRTEARNIARQIKNDYNNAKNLSIANTLNVATGIAGSFAGTFGGPGQKSNIPPPVPRRKPPQPSGQRFVTSKFVGLRSQGL